MTEYIDRFVRDRFVNLSGCFMIPFKGVINSKAFALQAKDKCLSQSEAATVFLKIEKGDRYVFDRSPSHINLTSL